MYKKVKICIRKRVFSVIGLIFLAIVVAFLFFLFKGKGNETYKAVEVNGKMIRAHVKGSGDKKIIMLSGWGTDSPIDDFFPLYDKLSENYQVVVLEYFGYSGSDITTDERANEAMVQEIRTALHKLNVNPPYILMPHSMSGLYSLYYANNYPSEVSGIIGIDMSLPQEQLERWNEETFETAKLSQESSNRNVSIINQWNKFYDNSKELKDVKYPSNLPVLAFLSTEKIETVNDMINCGIMRTSWTQMNDNMITNADIQTKKILKGDYYSQSDEIVKAGIEFIESL